MDYTLITVGAFEVNCALLWSDPAREAWVIDPGEEAGAILDALRRRGLTLARILLTHGHIDHIAALDDLLRAFPETPVAMHAADAAWAFGPANRLPPYLTVPRRPATLQTVDEGDLIVTGALQATVLHTPGHSPGCLCLCLDGGRLLFTGDTLFAGTVGRTDLPGGNGAKLARSLKRLAALPGDWTVIPGHGPATTLAAECRVNPFLARVSPRQQGAP